MIEAFNKIPGNENIVVEHVAQGDYSGIYEKIQKAMDFEKGGYTWNQNESLADLIKPERIRQIKLDAIKKQEAKRQAGSFRLVDNIGDIDENNFCANCFI